MYFRSLILFIGIISNVFSQDIVNSHPHLIFNYAVSNPESDTVTVYSRINNEIIGHSSNFLSFEPQGKPTLNFDIPKKQFELEKKIAKSVFQAITGSGSARGTAFLIGQNLVLTNKHVLANNNNECRRFGIFLNHKKEIVDCEKVLLCSSRFDFCLIEMALMKNKKNIGEEVDPLILSPEKPNSDEFNLLIGNAMGMGIEASSYKGIVDLRSVWGHFNRAFSGNSGSPLLNTNGKVIGIHYARSKRSDSLGGPLDRNYGMAVKSSQILLEIQNILTENNTLKEDK